MADKNQQFLANSQRRNHSHENMTIVDSMYPTGMPQKYPNMYQFGHFAPGIPPMLGIRLGPYAPNMPGYHMPRDTRSFNAEQTVAIETSKPQLEPTSPPSAEAEELGQAFFDLISQISSEIVDSGETKSTATNQEKQKQATPTLVEVVATNDKIAEKDRPFRKDVAKLSSLRTDDAPKSTRRCSQNESKTPSTHVVVAAEKKVEPKKSAPEQQQKKSEKKQEKTTVSAKPQKSARQSSTSSLSTSSASVVSQSIELIDLQGQEYVSLEEEWHTADKKKKVKLKATESKPAPRTSDGSGSQSNSAVKSASSKMVGMIPSQFVTSSANSVPADSKSKTKSQKNKTSTQDAAIKPNGQSESQKKSDSFLETSSVIRFGASSTNIASPVTTGSQNDISLASKSNQSISGTSENTKPVKGHTIQQQAQVEPEVIKVTSISSSDSAKDKKSISTSEFSNIGCLRDGRKTYSLNEILSVSHPKNLIKMPTNILEMIKLIHVMRQYRKRMCVATSNNDGRTPRNSFWQLNQKRREKMSKSDLDEEDLKSFIVSSLNKLSETSFDVVSKEIANGPLDSESNIRKFIVHLYFKSIDDVKCITLYAKLLKHLFKLLEPKIKKIQSIISDGLAEQCDLIKRDSNAEKVFDLKQLEKRKGDPNYENYKLLLYEKEVAYKRKYRGNAEMISTLFRENIISSDVYVNYVENLIKESDDFSSELLCRSLTISGKWLESKKPGLVERCFRHFEKIEDKLTPRIKFRISDLVETRNNKWPVVTETSVNVASILTGSQSSSSSSSSGGGKPKPDWSQGVGGRNSRSSNSGGASSRSSYTNTSAATPSQSFGSYDQVYSSGRSSASHASIIQSSSHKAQRSSDSVPSSGVPLFFTAKSSGSITGSVTDTDSKLLPQSKKQSSLSDSSADLSLSSSQAVSSHDINSKINVETLKELSTSLLKEVSLHYDVDILDASIMKCDVQLKMSVFVKAAFEMFVESACGHLQLGNYFVHLISKSLMKQSDLVEGIKNVMNIMNDLSLDVPNAFDRMTIMLLPVVCSKLISLSQLYHIIRTSNEMINPSTHIINILCQIKERLSIVDAISVWLSFDTPLSRLEPAVTLNELKSRDLEALFYVGSHSSATAADSPELMEKYSTLANQKSVHQLLSDENCSSDQILELFQDESHYAHGCAAEHVLKSLYFDTQFGSDSVIKQQIMETMESHQPLLEWMYNKDVDLLISMVVLAHGFTHSNNHIPSGLIPSVTYLLLSKLPTITPEMIIKACEKQKPSCFTFERAVKKGISDFQKETTSNEPPPSVTTFIKS